MSKESKRRRLTTISNNIKKVKVVKKVKDNGDKFVTRKELQSVQNLIIAKIDNLFTTISGVVKTLNDSSVSMFENTHKNVIEMTKIHSAFYKIVADNKGKLDTCRSNDEYLTVLKTVLKDSSIDKDILKYIYGIDISTKE